jgi:hypothetical protein
MHKCLYIDTSACVDEFKEVSHMIRCVLSVRVLVWVLQILTLSWVLQILTLSCGILQGLILSFACSCCSHLLIGRRLG